MTQCAQCGFDNPRGMRFCGNCGAPLGEAQNASAPLLVDQAVQKVGPAIGQDLMSRVQQAGIDAAGQRRNVTVLFADLSGYTSLADRLDNEDVYDLISQFVRLLIDDVNKYEGVVDKLTGDGVMALFGAPIAYENNAERAIRAALDMQTDVAQLSQDMQARLGVELRMRVGLHAGSVIVGGLGTNMMMDYTAIGDTVNLAQRLEEAAEPGTVLVSEAVYRLTRRLFDFNQTPPLSLKGIPHPLVAYQVGSLKTTPGSVRGVEGLRAPMIGRDLELTQLHQALTALSEGKSGQFVLVTGEAGIGKSRLTAELKSTVDTLEVRILEGSSLTYRRSISYWLFLDLMRNYLGVTTDTPEGEVSQKLWEAAYKALGKRANELLPFLEHFLSVQSSNPAAAERIRYLDASQLRQQIFLAFKDLLVAEATHHPLLLILEDLHWADEASLDLLAYLLDTVRHVPVMIYAISRPIVDAPMQKIVDWAEKYLPDRFLSIRLQSLSPDQSNALLQKLLSMSDFPEYLRNYILDLAAGVPFYLEEILRMFIDGGILQRGDEGWNVPEEVDIDNLGIPDTLQGLIMARFDRLNEFQRHILQIASVIGHQFSLRLLNFLLAAPSESIVVDDLNQLAEREFVIRLAESPSGDYSFRHVLMSEAIYGTILKRERNKLHGQVGRAIEALYSGRIDDQVELLARHYGWSPQLDRALHYSILAGQKAAASYLNDQSLQQFQQALELLAKVSHTPEQARQVHVGLGDVQSLVGDYASAFQNYQTALETFTLDEKSSLAHERSSIHRKIARSLERQGEYEQALEHLDQAQAALAYAAISSPVERAHILNDTGWIHFRKGNFVEAENLLSQALSLVENSDAYDAIASIYNRLGGIAYNQADWNRTADYLRKSIAIRESIGDVVGLATSFNNLGLLGIEMGDFDNALENLTHSYELKTRLGQAEGISMALNNLGWLRIQRGELEEAAQCLNQAFDLARQIGYTSLTFEIRKNLAELYLASQNLQLAREALSENIQLLTKEGANDQLVDTYRLLGEIALAMGDMDLAKACAERIQSLTVSLSENTRDLSTIQRGEFWRFRGMLATALGEWDAAARFLKTGEKIFQSLGSRFHQGRAAFQLGALAEAQGDLRTAQLRYREAVLLFRSVGARLEQQRSEEAFQRQVN